MLAQLVDLVPGDGRPIGVEDAAGAFRVRVPVLHAHRQNLRLKKGIPPQEQV